MMETQRAISHLCSPITLICLFFFPDTEAAEGLSFHTFPLHIFCFAPLLGGDFCEDSLESVMCVNQRHLVLAGLSSASWKWEIPPL